MVISLPAFSFGRVIIRRPEWVSSPVTNLILVISVFVFLPSMWRELCKSLSHTYGATSHVPCHAKNGAGVKRVMFSHMPAFGSAG